MGRRRNAVLRPDLLGLAAELAVASPVAPTPPAISGPRPRRTADYRQVSGRPSASGHAPADPARLTQPLVSILISNYNYAQFVGAAIDSALSQTYPNVEVIVVDDGSTDASASVINAYGARITAIFTPNSGQAAAFNAGFPYCRGEIICLLDSDDAFEPEKVDRVVAAARRMPEAQLICHRLRIVDADDVPVGPTFPRHLPGGDLIAQAMRAGGWFPHPVTSGLAFRRGYAERLFPLPLWHAGTTSDNVPIRICADTYLARPAALLGPVAAIDEPLTRYRDHGGNCGQRLSSTFRMQRHRAEFDTLRLVMQNVFGRSVKLDVAHHLDYQLARCSVGDASRVATIVRILASGSLPLAERLREALRVSANRGWAGRS